MHFLALHVPSMMKIQDIMKLSQVSFQESSAGQNVNDPR